MKKDLYVLYYDNKIIFTTNDNIEIFKNFGNYYLFNNNQRFSNSFITCYNKNSSCEKTISNVGKMIKFIISNYNDNLFILHGFSKNQGINIFGDIFKKINKTNINDIIFDVSNDLSNFNNLDKEEREIIIKNIFNTNNCNKKISIYVVPPNYNNKVNDNYIFQKTIK